MAFKEEVRESLDTIKRDLGISPRSALASFLPQANISTMLKDALGRFAHLATLAEATKAQLSNLVLVAGKTHEHTGAIRNDVGTILSRVNAGSLAVINQIDSPIDLVALAQSCQQGYEEIKAGLKLFAPDFEQRESLASARRHIVITKALEGLSSQAQRNTERILGQSVLIKERVRLDRAESARDKAELLASIEHLKTLIHGEAKLAAMTRGQLRAMQEQLNAIHAMMASVASTAILPPQEGQSQAEWYSSKRLDDLASEAPALSDAQLAERDAKRKAGAEQRHSERVQGAAEWVAAHPHVILEPAGQSLEQEQRDELRRAGFLDAPGVTGDPLTGAPYYGDTEEIKATEVHEGWRFGQERS